MSAVDGIPQPQKTRTPPNHLSTVRVSWTWAGKEGHGTPPPHPPTPAPPHPRVDPSRGHSRALQLPDLVGARHVAASCSVSGAASTEELVGRHRRRPAHEMGFNNLLPLLEERPESRCEVGHSFRHRQ